MNLSQMLPDISEVPQSLVDDAIYDSFTAWTTSKGITLYPAQDEAIVDVLSGDNVILATPTGSGKSMVAIASHFIAMARGQRSFYTAPIKALVSEKFFDLCAIFGPESVGMMTGDATVNSKAPIICATAEIVANIALRDGEEAAIDQVVMDEFHYYSDPDRGWAWQVPLLELPHAQFILMSATLGDTTFLAEDLTRRTGRTTQLVGSDAQRPVPLEFEYVYTPIQETIEELIKAGKSPIYVVHFTQREAIERAEALAATLKIDKETKEAIAKEIGDFRFSTTFGKTLSKLLRRGIGVHHAGMLPKYRRLVEKLAQTGLLTVICGTDTLGVGINVPIRTVLFSGLAKYDGVKQRILASREFHQIAGRAGRAGYDAAGTVVVEATDHEIENWRARERAGSDPKKLKKLRKKSARDGEVSWTNKTFDRLQNAEPEQLTSQFGVSNSLLLNVLSRPGNAYQHLKKLLRENHNSRDKQNKDILQALELFRGLINSGIVERLDTPDKDGNYYQLTQDLPLDFALNQPLAPFALAAFELLDPESDTYTLDLISIVEAIMEDPRPLLYAQEKKARGDEIAALKADGVDYTDRMKLVEDITWPKPLEDLLEPAYLTFCKGHPWAKEFDISPKSVLRTMLETGMTFSDLIATYGVARAEGSVLRYLSDIWRTLSHSVPEEYLTPELEDIIDWLGELIRNVDSSLIDEWALLSDPDAPISEEVANGELAFGVEDPTALTANSRAFTVMVRNYFFRIVHLLSLEQEDALFEEFEYLEEQPQWGQVLDDYFEDYDDLDAGASARGKDYFLLNKGVDGNPREWAVTQILKDPEGDNSFQIQGIVDLDASDSAGEVRLKSLKVLQS